MPQAYPAEFRRDVVAVARSKQSSMRQVAKDFGISEATLHNWLKRADIEDGVVPGVTVVIDAPPVEHIMGTWLYQLPMTPS